MTYPREDVSPIPVTVGNWPDIKRYNSTTVRTYVIDPAGTGDGKMAQIASYEPTRVCLKIRPIDAAIALTAEPPKASPDPNTGAGTAPQGAYIPQISNGPAEDIPGSDPWWINSLATITRVTVIKVYETNGHA